MHAKAVRSAKTDCIGTVAASLRGIYMDAGTLGMTVENVHFRNAAWGGVGMHETTNCRVAADCSFALPDGVSNVRFDHWSAPEKRLP